MTQYKLYNYLLKNLFSVRGRQSLFLINLWCHANGPSLISMMLCHVVYLASEAQQIQSRDLTTLTPPKRSCMHVCPYFASALCIYIIHLYYLSVSFIHILQICIMYLFHLSVLYTCILDLCHLSVLCNRILHLYLNKLAHCVIIKLNKIWIIYLGNRPPVITIQKLPDCVIINWSGSVAAVVCLQIKQNTLYPHLIQYSSKQWVQQVVKCIAVQIKQNTLYPLLIQSSPMHNCIVQYSDFNKKCSILQCKLSKTLSSTKQYNTARCNTAQLC